MVNDEIFHLKLTSAKTLGDTTTFINNNSLTFENVAVNLNLSNQGLLRNETSGVMDIQSTSGTGIYQTGTGGTFENLGTINKTDGDGYDFSAYFFNTGTINVLSGDITIDGSPVHLLSGGEYNTDVDCFIYFNGQTEFEGSITGTSDGGIENTGVMHVNSAASFEILNNGFQWKSGSLVGGGVLTNNEKFEISSTATHTNTSTTLENENLLTILDNGVINLANGAQIINTLNGVVDLQATSSSGVYQTGSGGAFENHGTIDKTAGSSYDVSAYFYNTVQSM